jgi:hypothetical protein
MSNVMSDSKKTLVAMVSQLVDIMDNAGAPTPNGPLVDPVDLATNIAKSSSAETDSSATEGGKVSSDVYGSHLY